MSPPTAEQEVWRYSRIGELQLDRFHPVAPSTTVHGANGFVADRHDLDTTVVHDIFDELSASFYGETVLAIPRGVAAGSIIVTHTVHGNDEASFPRLVIDAGEDSEVTVVERFMSDGDGAALVVPRLFVRAQQAARVTYVAINELSTSVWQLGHQQATRRARLDHVAGHGGARRRIRQGAHRRQGCRAGRQHSPGRAVLRRRHADARLPHAAGSRRPTHDQRPAVQGRRAGHRAEACTPVSSASATRPRARSPIRPTATSRSARARGRRACPTSRSRPTT